jgi:hypothetical protein
MLIDDEQFTLPILEFYALACSFNNAAIYFFKKRRKYCF